MIESSFVLHLNLRFYEMPVSVFTHFFQLQKKMKITHPQTTPPPPTPGTYAPHRANQICIDYCSVISKRVLPVCYFEPRCCEKSPLS